MENKKYFGIFFKPRNGGLVCIYDPDICPRFWYFKSGDNIAFIAKKLIRLAENTHTPIVCHINMTYFSDKRQSDTYNQFIGMLAGLSTYRNVTFKLVEQSKVQNRVMQLLVIAKKREFKTKLITKSMHGNQYNTVYETTNRQSRQNINIHMWAYLLAYYGYLKDKIKRYNKGDNDGQGRNDGPTENDGTGPKDNK